MVFYFASELAIHWAGSELIEHSGFAKYTKQAVNVGLHESMELIVVTGIFFIYRARPRGEFFSLMLQHDDVRIPRIIPFYVADKAIRGASRTAGKYAVILKPRTEEAPLMASVLLGISSRDGDINRPSDPGNPSQPLLARSVELQTY